MNRRASSVTVVGAVCIIATFGVIASAQEVRREDLLDGLANPERWLTYSGNYTGQRNSPLTQITTENVRRLAPRWTFQTGVLGKFEATPIVLDGILFVTGQDNHAWALDARTGRSIWHYQKPLPDLLNVCCGSVNRGFAIYRDRLYMATLDARLVALDAKTGSLIWDVDIADPERGYSATAAPLVVKDMLVVGIAGAEYGTRGFLDAYDAGTGKRRWRFWTVPEPGKPGGDTWAGDAWERGGGSTWLTGTYDPELNLIYWGTGNPGPDLLGEVRPGDNLYTDSVVALDADSGELRWYYQFTPHDTHDWDSNQVPVLADIEGESGTRKLLMLANRNGFFYTLDRTNGELLVGKPFVHTTWATEIGPDGRPILLPNNTPSAEGSFTCPDVEGATNWMSPSFNPSTGWLYVTAREACATFYAWPQEFIEGQYYFGGTYRPSGPRAYSALRAIDPLTAEVKWEFKYFTASMGGTLSTDGGLVFGGDMDGNVMAFDARTGENLWHFQTGASIYASPITYMLDGTQYVMIPSGTTLFAFALPKE